MLDWRFATAAAGEAVRAYSQLTGDYSLAGAASYACGMICRAYMMGGEL